MLDPSVWGQLGQNNNNNNNIPSVFPRRRLKNVKRDLKYKETKNISHARN